MSNKDTQQLTRVPSGVAGLDEILRGGFFGGGLYIVEGPPGAGKTILGNQICFNQASSGSRVLYVTLIAETVACCSTSGG
jgi:circadian clock protein KaiC